MFGGPRWWAVSAKAIAALALAVAASVLAFYYLEVLRPEPAGEALRCMLLPGRAAVYVAEGGCGVPVLEVIVVGEGCAGGIPVSGVEIYGFGVAKPVAGEVVVPGGSRRALLIVYPNPYRGGLAVGLLGADGVDAVGAALRYIDRGLCVRGFEPDVSYPGALYWGGGRVTYFTWVAVPAGG